MSESSRSVLVIDDDKNQRGMLSFALRDLGYRVVAVASGAEAVESARAETFDAAICDIMMPGQDGIETLRQLKSEHPKLEVVMATGYGTTQTALKAMRLGACNYVTKPYELSDLIAVLDQALEKARAREDET